MHKRTLIRAAAALALAVAAPAFAQGGIKEKILAAARSGVRQVILPDQNRNDWSEVPAEVRAKMNVHFVNDIAELLDTALTQKKCDL